MSQTTYPEKRLKIFLYLVALHSAGVAIGLLVLPSALLPLFGLYGYSGRFFQMQAGVFHFVMVIAYLMAAADFRRSPMLVYFSVSAKSLATVFLLLVYLLAEPSWLILFSGLADGAMGLLIWMLYRQTLEQSA